MRKNHNLSQSNFEYKLLVPVFCISNKIKQVFIKIIAIVLSHSVCIKCCKITFFTYFFFAMFLVAILSSRFHNNAKAAAWALAMLMNKVVQIFHWLMPGLKTNVVILDSRILQILKSLIPPKTKPQKRCVICATKGKRKEICYQCKNWPTCQGLCPAPSFKLHRTE